MISKSVMSDEAAAFDALAEEFFSVWFRYHPDVAAEAGIRGFERLLPAQGDDELSALGAWLETLVVALEELDYGALDPARQLDLRLMFGAASVEHRELLERDWRHRDPLRFLPVAEIYHLTLQPPPDIRDVLADILGAIPEYLRSAMSQLRPMAELLAPVMVSAAVDEAERGRCYLQELVNSPWMRRNCYSFSEMEALADAACNALGAYQEALRNELAARAAGRLGCGEPHLRFLFRHRHFMDLDSRQARNQLEEALGCCDDDLATLCAGLDIPPDQVWKHLNTNFVDGSGRLDACRAESDRLAELLEGSGFVTLPDADLHIVERSACPRPERFGADYRADREQGRGVYFQGASAGEPLARLRARCLEKTWGGSHLIAFSAGDAGWRLPRRLCDGAGLKAAWSLYLRERLGDLGVLDPDDRLLAALHRRESIRWAMVDLELHSGAWTETEARSRLDNVSDSDGSRLIRLVRRPGDALAAVLGWLALSRSRRTGGGGSREADFHDRLLSAGDIPLSLVLGGRTGANLSEKVSA